MTEALVAKLAKSFDPFFRGPDRANCVNAGSADAIENCPHWM
ncbi:hypothetical protein RMSM_03324 [Rhodopirellula maiorica SM1]|uniref:Uncharacterized protein n=1 Tax=Rhodopirellula maiorica SM1 TaxID=1265738 RepID=M5RKC8_9BACT|nr:hypothetical protein RMSM_03324 [Rhodopirellula maiorica SM1]